jgi:N-acetylglucosamine kinase-like BadF-type ATPase
MRWQRPTGRTCPSDCWHEGSAATMTALLLGVDGGATKTVALVAGADGRVLGAGRDGSSDIHAAADPSGPLDSIAAAVLQATHAAGVAPADARGSAFSLCGADWPEDVEVYETGLRERLGLAGTPLVVNDAVGALWAGAPDGVGVSLVLGTGGCIGARSADGTTWFSGMRLEGSGAGELGHRAYSLMLRGEYGAGPVPAFQADALAALGASSVEELVHAITARGGLGSRGVARLAPVLLEAGHRGDPQARAIIADHAALLAGYVRAASRRVGHPEEGVTLVVTGGVLRHHCRDLVDHLSRALPEFRLVRASVEPVYGALLLAAHEARLRPGLERLRQTGPDAAFFETL